MTRCFTTSWDDGHPLDVRLAELLARHNCKGTFYVPAPSSGLPLMNTREIRRLAELGMEVGAHTVSHSVLTQLDSRSVREELIGGKQWLEDVLGMEVPSFCFPLGKFNRRVCRMVEECGYRLARTTVAFHTDFQFEPLSMPVSFQFLPHPRNIHVRHGLAEGNAAGLLQWASRWRFESDLESLTARMAEHVGANGGMIHIWGHSWELDEYDLWEVLDRCLARFSSIPGVRAATNSDLLECRS